MQTHMKPIAAILFVLLCAVPALAQSAPPAAQSVAVQPAAERETFVEKAKSDVSVWRDKIDAFGTHAKGATVAAADDADRYVHGAWADLQTASQRLQTVGAEGWDGAKASYEKASNDLATAWHKVHPEQT